MRVRGKSSFVKSVLPFERIKALGITAVFLLRRVVKAMKGLLIFPPQWYPGNPYPAVPLLLGQLKRAGHAATGLDLNIDFYNHILTKEYLEKSIQKAEELVSSSKGETQFKDASNARMKSRASIISDCLARYGNKLKRVPAEVDGAVKTLKTSDSFYDPERLYAAKSTLFDALKIASLPYAPAELSFANYYNPAVMSGAEELLAECYNPETNMFLEFFEQILPGILEEQAEYILISIADMTQLIPALTLGRLLKQHGAAPVCIGGSIVTKLLESIRQCAEFLGKLCDYFCYGDGESGIVTFAEYLNGKVSVESVPGLVYKNASNQVVVNPAVTHTDLNTLADLSFDGFAFEKYFSPEPVLSVQLSKGCYWGKCAFCDVSYSRKQFCIKTPERAVEELKTLKERYNINNFLLSDDSVSPAYYATFARRLIESGLEVNLFSMARLEVGFTKEVLRDMQKAGCKMVFWGYEAASERVMSLINKGIDTQSRVTILRDSAETGIWNHVAFMIGFPTETKEEAIQTVQTIYALQDVLDSCYLSKFSFKKNAAISECPEQYGITQYEPAGDFQLDCKYRAPGMTDAEKKDIGNSFRTNYLNENADRLWPLLCLDFEHLLLYLSNYGKDRVKKYRLTLRPEDTDGFIAYL